jgi:hypothetical protein
MTAPTPPWELHSCSDVDGPEQVVPNGPAPARPRMTHWAIWQLMKYDPAGYPAPARLPRRGGWLLVMASRLVTGSARRLAGSG